MSKYYVSCGNKNLLISSESGKVAAMRLIDTAMSEHIWIYNDETLDEQNRRDHIAFEALINLGTSVQVSERGIGRNDVCEVGVPELLEEWHQLMTGLSRLFANLDIN